MSDLLIQAQRFYNTTSNRGHADRELPDSIDEEIRIGLDGGRNTAGHSLDLIEGSSLSVLDVGCSWGPIVFGAAACPRVKEVVGVDVEESAVELGKAIARSGMVPSEAADRILLLQGAAEDLPFPDNRFDLIVCHTVIEHVFDVEKALVEMYRVLKPGGVLDLEAPNYQWPYEPHLHLWMLPRGPKRLVKLLARFKRGVNPEFIDHLQFVHPHAIERILKRHGIPYRNTYLGKLEEILLQGDYRRVQGLNSALPALSILRRLGVARLIYAAARRLAIYPSLSYQIVKPDCQ